MSTRFFKGRVGGVEYSEPTLFESAAKALGYRAWRGTNGKWTIGTAVAVTFDNGTRGEGQVWSLGRAKGSYWVALEGGRYVLVHSRSGTARSESGDLLGKVA